jgi:hypothetical protein
VSSFFLRIWRAEGFGKRIKHWEKNWDPETQAARELVPPKTPKKK